jgi:hypothetical protein
MLLLSIIIERVVVNVRPQHMHTHKHTSCNYALLRARAVAF